MKEKLKSYVSAVYDHVLSVKSKRLIEMMVFGTALTGFFLHLVFIGMQELDWITIGSTGKGMQSPIDALYTPFSIILFYEVYCLIYYVPKSITIYIGKQFEIIALITIRGIFDELSKLTLTSDVGELFAAPDFFYSMATILLIFLLIYLFYQRNQKSIRVDINTTGLSPGMPKQQKRYITVKKVLALLLAILFLVMVVLNLVEWLSIDNSLIGFFQHIKLAKGSFFSDFFMVLILTDVLILLFSFAITDNFPKVMRNSGFVVSTTLIKLSFNVEGLASHLLVIMAVLFGTLMLSIYKMYRKIELPDEIV
jgi:hypothetical protein